MNTSQKTTIDLARSSYSNERFNFTKGILLALVPITILTLLLSGFLGVPFSREISLKDWAKAAPVDFLLTTAQELANQADKGSNGPPYNLLSAGERLGPINLQDFGGLDLALDPASEFVIGPLEVGQQSNVFAAIGAVRDLSISAQTEAFKKFITAQNASVGKSISEWKNASSSQQSAWTTRYMAAMKKAVSPRKILPDSPFGPVQELTQALLQMAETGTLDGIMVTKYTSHPSDFTAPALFLGDGKYFQDVVYSHGIDQSRMALSTGTDSYPGQFWLRPINIWYSMKPFSTSKNADIEVFFILLIVFVGLVYLPKIPVLNRTPRLLPFHRVRVKTRKPKSPIE